MHGYSLRRQKYNTSHIHCTSVDTAVTASILPVVAQFHLRTLMSICWLRTHDGTEGPSKLVSNYFVSHTDIIKTPQHNLFTARRWSVGSAHLPHWNNCCDDRLCWEHVQAWENKHHFWLEVVETKPSWHARIIDISPVQSFRSLDQFFFCALSYWMSKGFHGNFFYSGLPPSLMCLEMCQNAALQDLNAVVSILHGVLM